MADSEGQSAEVMLYIGVFEVALGASALLWGDLLLPLSVPIPILSGLSHAKLVGIVLLVVAAPITFAMYYLRRKQETEKISATRGPVEKL